MKGRLQVPQAARSIRRTRDGSLPGDHAGDVAFEDARHDVHIVMPVPEILHFVREAERQRRTKVRAKSPQLRSLVERRGSELEIFGRLDAAHARHVDVGEQEPDPGVSAGSFKASAPL